MDAVWERLKNKWPAYPIDESDDCLFDLAPCQFVGVGPHEFVVYSFRRLTRQADHRKTATYPLAMQFGIHYPDFVSNEEPAIGHLRTRFSGDPTGLLEPVQILAIISTANGSALWNTLHEELKRQGTKTLGRNCRQYEVWYDSHIDHILKTLRSIDVGTLPTFEPMKSPESCAVSISVDDLPEDPYRRTSGDRLFVGKNPTK